MLWKAPQLSRVLNTSASASLCRLESMWAKGNISRMHKVLIFLKSIAQRKFWVPFFLTGTMAEAHGPLEGSTTPACSQSSIWRRRSASWKGFSGRNLDLTGLAPGSMSMVNCNSWVRP